jgi:hypothetical protein
MREVAASAPEDQVRKYTIKDRAAWWKEFSQQAAPVLKRTVGPSPAAEGGLLLQCTALLASEKFSGPEHAEEPRIDMSANIGVHAFNSRCIVACAGPFAKSSILFAALMALSRGGAFGMITAPHLRTFIA